MGGLKPLERQPNGMSNINGKINIFKVGHCLINEINVSDWNWAGDWVSSFDFTVLYTS